MQGAEEHLVLLSLFHHNRLVHHLVLNACTCIPYLCELQLGAHTLRRRRSGTPFWMHLGTRTTCPT